MATIASPAIRIYRRPSARFDALREALDRGAFHVVRPPDAMADWECVDDKGTRVRCAGGALLVEAGSEALADAFDAQFRIALPSEHAIPDGGPPPQRVEVIAGSDESGKGDRAYALAVAAVLVPCAREHDALLRGVRDSKACAARDVRDLSWWIQQEFACEVRVIPPETRDQVLHRHGGNESRLLAAMHAECLCALRARHGFLLTRVDRFAQGRPVAVLVTRGYSEMLIDECVRGERHVAVAAASIVARSLAQPS